MNSVPHSSALYNISSFDYCNYLETRMCRSKPVEITHANGSRSYFAIEHMIMFIAFKTAFRTAKHKKTSQVSIVFHDEFVRVVQCYSIKCGT